MAFLPSLLSNEELHHFHRVITHSMEVKSHFDVLVWLQGDMQKYLPHDIMIAAWGDFADGHVQHDIISAISGVRSHNSNPANITPLLRHLFRKWNDFGNKAFTLNSGESGFLLQNSELLCSVGAALQKMRSAMIHGIKDERGSHDCLYVCFGSKDYFSDAERGAMAMILPHIDAALRQVEHLPHQTNIPSDSLENLRSRLLQEHNLSEREAEILKWVALGKTNPEIGSILEISAFTVKNHMQRVFKKLDVSNRAQAVSKFKALANNNG